MRFKINFGIFKKINNAVAVALELKKYLALWESCHSLLPEWIKLRDAIAVPLVNLLIEFRKKVAEAEAIADETESKLDDKVIGAIAGVADQVLEFFHCQDDYKKLSDLDKAVKPQ